MKFFEDDVTDIYGNVKKSLSVTIKCNGSTATIYSDSSGTVAANPATTDASTGVLSFWYNTSGTYTFDINGTTVKTIYLAAFPTNVIDLGAKGDGSSNSTTAFSTAATWGGQIEVPDGTFLTDPITCAVKANWNLSPNATIKQRSATSGVSSSVLTFTSAAAGSSLIGGTIDGNRASIGSAVTSNAVFLSGVEALNCDDFLMRDVTIQNVTTFGWWVQGNRVVCENIKTKSCGKGSHIKKVYQGRFRGLTYQTIGAINSVTVTEHCNEWRLLTDTTFSDVVINGFSPANTGGEPKPFAITFENSSNITVDNVVIEGYTGTSSSGLNAGFAADTVFGLKVNNLQVSGYTNGVILNSCIDYAFANTTLDGQYVTGVDDGFTVTNTGLNNDNTTGQTSLNARVNAPSRDGMLTNVRVTRHNNGMALKADGLVLDSCQLLGNVQHGVNIDKSSANTSFPGQTAQGGTGIRLCNVVSRFNGRHGVAASNWQSITILDGDFRDNGQDSTQLSTLRAGIGCITSNAGGRIVVQQCRLGDSQTWTKTKGVSFVPATTNASNQITVYLPDPTDVHIGQWVKVVNGTGAADITAQVVDVQYDQATLQTSSAQTFSDTSNLTALTGTVTTSGNTVTGSGTAFTTEITGATVLKINGEYKRVDKVNSDTSLQIASAMSVEVSGVSASKVVCDLAAIQSQQYGARFPSTMTGPIVTRKNNYDGCVTQPMSIGTYTNFGEEAEVIASTAAAGVNLSTSGATTTLISGLPTGFTPVAARFKITTGVTGTDGTLNYNVIDGSGTISTIASSATYTSGTKLKGDAPSPFPFRSSGSLQVTISGGADNIASAGAVRADLLIRAPSYFADFS